MVTLVLAEEIQEPEIESEFGQTVVQQWHYRVPFPGVRYYSYRQESSPAEQAEPWLWMPCRQERDCISVSSVAEA